MKISNVSGNASSSSFIVSNSLLPATYAPSLRGSLSFLRALSVCLFIVVSLTGCPGKRLGLEPPINSKRATAAEAQQIFSWLKQSSQVNSLRLMSNLKISRGSKKESVKQVIVCRRPDKLRVEIFAPGVNHLLALFAARDGILRGLDASEKKYYIGRASTENFERTLTIPFLPDELMLWLVGKFPARSILPNAKIEMSSGDGGNSFYIRTTALEGRDVRMLLKREGTGLVRMTQFSMGKSAGSKAIFSSSFSFPNSYTAYPDTIRFSLEDFDGEITILQNSINTLPASADEKLFFVAQPGSYSKVDLD